MGYYSSLRESIEINPPLPWKDVRGSSFLVRGPQSAYPVTFDVDVQDRETDEGTLSVKVVIGIIPAWDDQSKMYGIEANIQQMIKEVPALQGRTLDGYLLRLGEEQGDVERYRVVEGKLVVEKAELRWPDGSLVEGHEL